MSDLDAASERVTQALSAAVEHGEFGDHAAGGMIIDHVTLVSYVDGNGEQCFATLDSNPDPLKRVGMLAIADADGREQFLHSWNATSG